ncbi:MAG: threonine/serine exporter family protein [Muribaculaceae bacterium]|nr:threonine/serine exporter family protein [Muribaculaceae bacterium]
MQIYDSSRPDVRTMAEFLAEYAVELFGNGCTCIRLEKNMNRIAESVGMSIEFSVLPRHLHITVSDGNESYTKVAGVRETSINYSRITDLSRLSWQMYDKKVSFQEASAVLPRIYKCSTVNPLMLVLLVSIANASFCRLFSGDIIAMCSVFVATFIGFRLKQVMTRYKINIKVTVITCAFVSSLITALSGLPGLGATPQIAVATSVLYLVPGIPFINSFCDFLDGHYLCAFGRLMNAIILLCCLSIGLCAGMSVMNLAMF